MQKLTSRDTKAEILRAYNELAKEYKALEKQKGASAPAGGGGGGSGSSSSSSASDDGEMSIADIITRLQGLTASIGESASSLQTELTTEATKLHGLRQSASGIIGELESLHDIEVGPDTLAQLITQVQETSSAADKELALEQEAFDKEMSAAKAAWKKEQDEHARATKEAAAELKKSRQRANAEYEYDLQQQHAQQQDRFAQERKTFDAELAELEERKNSEWAERHKQLLEREDEQRELEAKAAAFEGELDAAVKKAEQEGTGIARRQTKSAADLEQKDTDAVRRVFELKIQSLEGTIAKQDQQVEELSRQLETARKQTTELAVKAIDGASNASSFEAIKEIALEQAKNTQKGK